MTDDPHADATTMLARGLTAQDRVTASLRRIAARDPEIRAWTHLAAPEAGAAAALLDAADAPRGALHGVPIGVKDVIDVAGMPTGHNSPLGDPRAVPADAPCVAVLRAAGAIVLGKTDTTEFAAAGRNAATANLHAPARTPGGSSAGSAAAVADGHVPIALATQTGGSTIRPALFCGIYGMKPSWGVISREGMKLYANSLDTIGFHARSLADLDLLCDVFALAPGEAIGVAPAIGLCRSPAWPLAEPATVAAFAAAEALLRGAGIPTVTIDLPSAFDALDTAFTTILYREGGAAFLDLARTHGTALHADFHARIASRARFSDEQLRDAYDAAADARRSIEALMSGVDAVLTPSAPGVAPLGRGPGNPVFNQMWTLLHLPCVNLPLFRSADGLPVGLTLTAPRFHDRRLLRVAMAIVERTDFDPTLRGTA